MANPFLEDDDEDETRDVVTGDSENFKQLRSYAKKLEREQKAAEKELAELRAYRESAETEKRSATVKQVFTKVGLSEKHAALFAKVNDGDVTEEAVLAFATEYELPRAQPESGDAPAEGLTGTKPPIEEGIVELGQRSQQGAGFAPAQNAGSPQGSIITSVEDAVKLAAADPAEYARLREAGRIKFDRLG